MTTDEDHEARAKNWVLKMVGGPQLIGPAGIPPHVYWLLATVLDPEAATFMDYVVEIGSTLETATGSVVVIGDGQIVRIVLTDSPVRETDALATLEILPTSAIESIEVRGSAYPESSKSSEPGIVTVRLAGAEPLALPLSTRQVDVPELVCSLRDAAGWTNGPPR